MPDEDAVRALAAALDLDLPAECVPGVIETLALLERHAALIET